MPVDRDEDGESAAVIFKGASVRQLMQLFGADHTTVSRAVREMVPIGTRRGFPVYSVAKAAKKIVKPDLPVEDLLRKLDISDLPPTLNKEVWAAKRGQLLFEKEQGELWPTDRVEFTIGHIFRRVQMALRVIPDRVADAMQLDDKSRAMLEELCDAQLEDIRETLIRDFDTLPALTPGITDFESDADQDQATEDEEFDL